MHKIFVLPQVYFKPLHVSSTCAHHQEIKISLHSLWYHHTYRYDDTRGCVMKFWSPYDEHMCSKHVEAWNKLILKQKFCVPTWLITEINILRCRVSKTSKRYMFRTVPRSIIRSFHCTHSRGICHTACNCQQTCMIYTIALCAVKKLLMVNRWTVRNM